ncbi:MAG TPA: ROK family protein [Vicinamibacterales bacterium]|nr:ROK family protein [Vicinamibacterales bacterium]
MLLGGIEAGGTKCLCVVGTGPADIRAERRIPTTSPAETLAAILDFFASQYPAHGALAALGVGSFGPVDLDPGSPAYGCITSTPKPGWAGTDVVGTLRRALDVPVAFDTDVNAAAIGEWRHGAGQGLDTLLYLTVGTGIGGGALVGGRPVHGLVHPEMGHIRIPHDRIGDPFPGVCSFHDDCLEGLACGPAIAARWEQPADSLPPDHPAWALEARYLALALHTFVCTLSPQRIVLGGGVMQQPGLLSLVRRDLAMLLNGYIQSPALRGGLDSYVVAPALGARSGVVGALAMAERALPTTLA